MNVNQGSDKILNLVLSNVQSQSELELSSVKEEFLKELAQAQEELLKDVNERLHSFRDESRLSRERSMLDIDLEIKKRRFEIFDAIVADVVKRVKEKIENIRETPLYKEALKRFIDKALKYAPSKETIVEGNIEDQRLLREIVKEMSGKRGFKISLSTGTIETVGGLNIKSKDGTFAYLSTVEVRIEELKEELRKTIMEELIRG
jgi:vacuolar-type H+-ATPase subunit E/Vma4